jgi:hypothetical protein
MNYPHEEWSALIEGFYRKMLDNADIADARLPDGEWTLRDMVAHLVDSFSNNHQRFVRLQLETGLDFPGYDAETWRSVSAIDGLDYRFLCGFWKTCNEFLLSIIGGIAESSLDNIWNSPDGPKSLGFLVGDYFRHIRWHIDFFDERVAVLRKAGSD